MQALESIDTSSYSVPNTVIIESRRGSFKGKSSGGRGAQANNTGPNCKCKKKLPSKLVTVRKEGKNQGRLFYACGQPKESGCGYFLWVTRMSSLRIPPTRPSTHPPNLRSGLLLP